MSTSPSPWRTSHDRSSSSLGSRLEVRIPQAHRSPTESPSPSQAKLHPPLPLRHRKPSNYSNGPSTPSRQSFNTSSNTSLEKAFPKRPTLSPYSISPPLSPTPKSPVPRSPAPSMSNSPKKILQLTGHDPRLDRSLPVRKDEESSDEEKRSSGSVYNTFEDGNRRSSFPGTAEKSFQERHEGEEKGRDEIEEEARERSAPRSPRDAVYGTYSGWSFSSDEDDEDECEVSTPTSGDHRSSGFIERIHTDESTGEDGKLFQELQRDVQYPVNSRYRKEIAETRVALKSPVKGARKGKVKPQPIVVELPKKPSYLANARDSFAWSVDDTTPSPSKHKHYNTPVTGVFPPSNNLASPRHQPPSPLRFKRYGAEPSPLSETPEKFHKRFSNTMKHWSPIRSPITTKKTPPSPIPKPRPTLNTSSPLTSSPLSPTTTNSTNSTKSNRRPDTPIPSRSTSLSSTTSSFISAFSPTVETREHFLDAVGKARAKAHIKTKEERRRESLKKRIVVLGVADESPDGRVSEWL